MIPGVSRHRRVLGLPTMPVSPSDMFSIYPFQKAWVTWPTAVGTFNEPSPPNITSGIDVTVNNLAQMLDNMSRGNRTIRLAPGLVLPIVDGGTTDTDIIITEGSSIRHWYGSKNNTSGTGQKNSQRVRIRGPGTLGSMQFLPNGGAGVPSDIIIDGVVGNQRAVGSNIVQPWCSIDTPVARFVVLNSVIRACLDITNQNKGSVTEGYGDDIAWFNCRLATNPESGNANSWIWRYGPGNRYIMADCQMRKYSGQQPIFRMGSPGVHTGVLLRNNVWISPDGLIAKDEDPPYTNTEIYGDLNTMIIGGSLANFLGRQDQYGSGGYSLRTELTNTRWKSTDASFVNDARLLTLENAPAHGEIVQLRSGNSYVVDSIFSNLVPAWAPAYSPLTGVSLPGDPTALPTS